MSESCCAIFFSSWSSVRKFLTSTDSPSSCFSPNRQNVTRGGFSAWTPNLTTGDLLNCFACEVIGGKIIIIIIIIKKEKKKRQGRSRRAKRAQEHGRGEPRDGLEVLSNETNERVINLISHSPSPLSDYLLIYVIFICLFIIIIIII